MSEDLIKRSDVINLLWYFQDECCSAVVGDFEKLPSADRPQRWTPCSEGLPKKEEATYLICTEGGYMCSCRWTNDMYGLGSNEYSEWGWHIMDKPQYAKVVAWMGMEPWKGADDE